MRERLSNFIAEQYRKHIKNTVGEVKTKLGHQTGENIAKQIEQSTPVSVENLIGKDHKPTRINEFGEIVDEEAK